MDKLLQDVRYGLRSLGRSPGFAFTAILTLALGIAATTIVFSLVNALMLRPVPAAEPDRLFMLNESREGPVMTINGYMAMPPSRLATYAEAGDALLVGVAGERGRDMVLRRGDSAAEMIDATVVTANWFEIVGVDASMGRTLTAAADGGGQPSVVLSHAAWRDRFGSDPSVLGSIIRLDGQAYTVVGIGPEGFGGLHFGSEIEAWVPVEAYTRLHPNVEDPFGDGELWMFALARLENGVDPEAAAAALSPIGERTPLPLPEMASTATLLEPITRIPGGTRTEATRFMTMFFVTALLVLLIAGTNVTGMLLARATGRRREIAIRVAVGADRARVVRQLVTEGLLLFVLGAAAALLLSHWSLDALPGLLPSGAGNALSDVGLDGRVLGFALLMALLAGVSFTILPAMQVSRTDLVPALKDGTTGAGSGRMRMRRTFVVTQVAVSFLLLIVAGLFVRTLQRSFSTDVGFEAEGVVVALVDPAAQGYDVAAGRDLARRLLERVSTLPGVESAALAQFPPMSGWTTNTSYVPSELAGDSAAHRLSDYTVIGAGYFDALRVPFLAGRDFDGRDTPESPRVAIVNQAFVDSVFGGGSGVGRRVQADDGAVFEVVGVVATTKYRDMRDDQRPFLFQAYTQVEPERYTLVARAAGDPAVVLTGMRDALREVDPELALQRPQRLAEAIQEQLFPQRFAAIMVGMFGVLGMLLAAIGLYGVLAYHVGQRTREIGVRIALGARAEHVLRMVLRHGMLVAVAGVLFGLIAAVAATRLIGSMLIGVSATDPLTFLIVPLVLLTVAFAASWVPARRATRVDPTIALRSE